MKVVILAGGLGSRISEETVIKPKPLIEIGSMPIIWHIMKIYSYYGLNDFIICCGYKGNLIKDSQEPYKGFLSVWEKVNGWFKDGYEPTDDDWNNVLRLTLVTV